MPETTSTPSTVSIPKGLFGWLFDQYDLPKSSDILELGYGGAYQWQEPRHSLVDPSWSVTLTDFSLGMLSGARTVTEVLNFRYTQTDARWLPFIDNSFDRVTANHMLYHVTDRPAAFSEIHRVLRPGGKLFASTNSETTMRPLFALADSIQPGMYSPRTTDNFSLENGTDQMHPYFSSIETATYEDALHITEVQPVLDYVASTERFKEENLEPLASRVQSILDEHGVWKVGKLGGLFICTV
jgi:ubiquinone/menaquinone biosynthesis C-methylase UbiE